MSPKFISKLKLKPRHTSNLLRHTQLLPFISCITFLLVQFPVLSQLSGLSQKHNTKTYSIEPATAWSRLFKRQTGWTGADGIYSIQLPHSYTQPSPNQKSRILFLFSDTVIDTLVSGKPSTKGFTMIHNSVAILNGEQPDPNSIHFYWPQNKSGKPVSLFMPADKKNANGKPIDDSIYYWLGDGIALKRKPKSHQTTDATLAIFAYKMINTSSAAFGFKDIGNDLLLTDDHFNILKRIAIPLIKGGNFGAGIYKEDVIHKRTETSGKSHEPYIYIYGVRGMHKGLMVARTIRDNITHPEKWTYYTGKSWVQDIKACQDITAHVSNELSVTRTPDGQYALIYQIDGIQPYIGMKRAPTPYGPFGDTDTLWHCIEPTATNQIIVYNAKAHPSISPKGGLLISYNVNSLDFLKKLREEPTFYRLDFYCSLGNSQLIHNHPQVVISKKKYRLH